MHLHDIVLHCTALHCTALHCTALHCTHVDVVCGVPGIARPAVELQLSHADEIEVPEGQGRQTRPNRRYIHAEPSTSMYIRRTNASQ